MRYNETQTKRFLDPRDLTPEMIKRDKDEFIRSFDRGLKRELEIIADLNYTDFFDDGEIKHFPVNHHYDGYGLNHQYEIKSLDHSIHEWPTALMNVSKVLKKRPDENLVFIFSYTEANGHKELYYVRYDEAKFQTYQTRFIKRRDRTHAELCYDIPVAHLNKMDIYEYEE